MQVDEKRSAKVRKGWVNCDLMFLAKSGHLRLFSKLQFRSASGGK